jgi:hypothetical protein
MIERSLTIEDPAPHRGEPPPADGPDHLAESLEQRVHRLEDAVAALQDTQIMEERITERVLGKVSHRKQVDGTGIVEAERRTAPIPTPVPQATLPPVPPTPAPVLSTKPSWVVVEAFRDIRMAVAMFFDSRHRVSWGAYFALAILAYVLVSDWLWALWAGVPLLGLLSGVLSLKVIGPILDKALGLLFALFAFKRLARETRRYKESIAGQSATYSRY